MPNHEVFAIRKSVSRLVRVRIRVHGRCRTAQRPVPRRDAPARQSVPRAYGRNRPARPRLCGRTGGRWPDARALRPTTGWCASFRRRELRSIPPGGRSSSIDPRAGHGPGIGGFKADSEIGVALKAGHPCYFVGFLPEPVPGQTIEDITRAEAKFLEKVIALHPDADGKPCVDRQLPGRLGGDDACGPSPGARRPAHHCRGAAVVLGRRARKKSDALQRRTARRQLVDGADQ